MSLSVLTVVKCIVHFAKNNFAFGIVASSPPLHPFTFVNSVRQSRALHRMFLNERVSVYMHIHTRGEEMAPTRTSDMHAGPQVRSLFNYVDKTQIPVS